MNHPPKKKKKDPLLPEGNQIDERNLVDSEDSEKISFEDRATIYWSENKDFLIKCILILTLAIIGYQGMRILKESNEAKIQSKYVAAHSNNTLENFVDAYGDKPLGGFAALVIADNAYTEENYEKALEFYTSASSTLKDPTLNGRASIGQAFALYNTGKIEEGLAKLNAITTNTNLSEATRVEAAYHLAVEAHTTGRNEDFANYARQIENAKFASQWQQRLALIKN